MVTARLAIGSVSTLAFGALLLGSAPYWMHRSTGAAHATPWGAISSPDSSHAEAAPADDRAQLLKLAALKSGTAPDAGTPGSAPAAAVQPDPAPAPQPVAQMDVAPAPAPHPDAAPIAAVPAPDQQVASAEVPATEAASPDTNAANSDRVNINTASSAALDHLPGAGRIGHAIVSHRPYKSVKDLVSRRVLRMSDFEKIQSRISVD